MCVAVKVGVTDRRLHATHTRAGIWGFLISSAKEEIAKLRLLVGEFCNLPGLRGGLINVTKTIDWKVTFRTTTARLPVN